MFSIVLQIKKPHNIIFFYREIAAVRFEKGGVKIFQIFNSKFLTKSFN